MNRVNKPVIPNRGTMAADNTPLPRMSNNLMMGNGSSQQTPLHQNLESAPLRHTTPLKLLFFEVAESHVQHFRPWNPVLDGTSLGMLKRDTNNGEVLTVDSVNRAANNLLQPSTTPTGIVEIPNGFSNRRFAFYLLVEHKGPYSTRKFVYSGFTDHVGRSIQGTLDPRMTCYINAVTEVRPNEMIGPQGHATSHVFRSSHNVFRNPGQDIIPGRNVQSNNVTLVRPADVMGQAHLGVVSLSGYNDLNFRGSLARKPLMGDRTNNTAGGYVSHICGAYVNALRSEGGDGGEGGEGLYNKAYVNSIEKTLADDPLSVALTPDEADPVSSFTIGDLEVCPRWQLPPNFCEEVGSTGGAMSNPLQYTEQWGGAGLEVNLAFNIAQVISQIMAKFMLIEIDIEISNYSGTDSVAVGIPTPMFDGCYGQREALMIEDLIMARVVIGLLDQKVNSYFIRTNNRIVGFSSYEIGINGAHPVPFAVPSFADSMTNPNMTQDPHLAETLVTATGAMMGALSASAAEALGMTPGNFSADEIYKPKNNFTVPNRTL